MEKKAEALIKQIDALLSTKTHKDDDSILPEGLPEEVRKMAI